MEDINTIKEALYKHETIYDGKDGTVVAIASIAKSKYYAPIPLLISASCKKEKGEKLAEWLGLLLQVYRNHPYGEKVHGPIRAIASDGEASFRSARFILCMTQTLDPQSKLGKVLYQLPGLNCKTGECDVLGTCDFKHVIKCFATLTCSPVGTLIHGTTIIPQDILDNLISLGKSELDAKELLNPSDKQNVPKAVQLLQSLIKLKDTTMP
jgi:hypothetical protein